MQFMTASRSEAETAFIVVKNDEAAELIPGTVVEFKATTTDADQGSLVQRVQTAVHNESGIAAPLAGVVASTISTKDYGRVQVYGPATVRIGSTIALGRVAVATSAAVAPTGVAQANGVTSAQGVAYDRASLGVCIEDIAQTNCRVMLAVM